jgi:hypothetical protein
MEEGMAKKAIANIPASQRRATKPSEWCKGKDARRRQKPDTGKDKALRTRWSKT